MFARWHNVRLKAAEKALEQGRLDDALTAVRELLGLPAAPMLPAALAAAAKLAVPAGGPTAEQLSQLAQAALAKLASDDRAQKLFDAFVRPLTARARLNRQAGRYGDALLDLAWVSLLGRTDPDLATLRSHIESELRHVANRGADEQAAVQKAAEQIRAGRLDSGRIQVERVDDTRARMKLAAELDAREQRAAQLLQQADEALKANDALLAVRLWQDACQRYGQSQETDRFASRLVDACRAFVDGAHASGRIEALLAAQPAIARLAGHDPNLADCRRLIELCAQAVAQLVGHDYAGLRQTMLRMKAARGGVKWVNAVSDALERIQDAHDALLASPLGFQAGDLRHAGPAADSPAATRASLQPPLDPNAVPTNLPLLLLVDGGGSALLLATDRVRVGRGGMSHAIDVAIPADLEGHHADVLRRGEDYFLVAYGPARVNGAPVRQALLRDGDRVELGSARFTFHKPSTRSGSAVLRLSHRCRLAEDIGDIVLLADTCLIGSTTHCHVRTRDDGGQVVLFDVGGRLHVRQTAGDNHLLDRPAAVCANATIERGNVRVTVKPYALGRPATAG